MPWISSFLVHMQLYITSCCFPARILAISNPAYTLHTPPRWVTQGLKFEDSPVGILRSQISRHEQQCPVLPSSGLPVSTGPPPSCEAGWPHRAQGWSTTQHHPPCVSIKPKESEWPLRKTSWHLPQRQLNFLKSLREGKKAQNQMRD